jgi:PKD repeat protein
VGTFSDPGFTLADFRTRETFLARIDWGNGEPVPFGRVSLTNGAVGTATTGSVAGVPSYKLPGIYIATLKVTDDDGGESLKTFRVTVKPPTANSGVWWVPGVPGQATAVQYDYLPSITAYANELAAFPVDDAQGRIGTLLPGDAGYGAAAIQRFEVQSVFTQQDQPGAVAYRTYTAGQYLAFAIVKNGTLAGLRANNPTGGVANDPLVWFSTAAANADGGYQHFHRSDLDGGWVQYDTEDMMNGGDADFNDLVFRLQPVRQNPAVQSLSSILASEGSSAALTARVVDPTPGEVLTASIQWGDGTSSSGMVTFASGQGTVTGNHIYADNGSYTVTLTVTDKSGLTDVRTSTANITNVVPTLSAPAEQATGVNRVATLALGNLTDPGFNFPTAGTQETFTASVTWGDGTATEAASVSVVQGSAGKLTTGSVSGSHRYTAPGRYIATTTITDDDGGITSTTQTIVVSASAPSALTLSIPNSPEGASVSLVGGFRDDDIDEAHTATITWGDGTSSSGTVSFASGVGQVAASHVYADDKAGGYTVSLTITDKYGLSASTTTTALVSNVPPTVTPPGGQAIGVGVPLVLPTVTFTDPGFTFPSAGTQETFTASVTWGDSTPAEVASVTVVDGGIGKLTTGQVNSSHTYIQPGTYSAKVTVTDDNSGFGTGTVNVLVSANAPLLSVLTLPAAAEGSNASLSATFTDVDPNDTHTAQVSWGDGTTSPATLNYANGNGTLTASHIYADNKASGYNAVVTLTDKYGLTATKSATATITNVAPTLTAGSSTTGQAGSAIPLGLGNFTDPGFTFPSAGTQETFTANVNWGDGTATEAASVSVVQGNAGKLTTGSVSASHTFATAGTYRLDHGLRRRRRKFDGDANRDDFGSDCTRVGLLEHDGSEHHGIEPYDKCHTDRRNHFGYFCCAFGYRSTGRESERQTGGSDRRLDDGPRRWDLAIRLHRHGARSRKLQLHGRSTSVRLVRPSQRLQCLRAKQRLGYPGCRRPACSRGRCHALKLLHRAECARFELRF